jgi:hypothetical protein
MTYKLDKILGMQQWEECDLDTFCVFRIFSILVVIYFVFVWDIRYAQHNVLQKISRLNSKKIFKIDLILFKNTYTTILF